MERLLIIFEVLQTNYVLLNKIFKKDLKIRIFFEFVCTSVTSHLSSDFIRKHFYVYFISFLLEIEQKSELKKLIQ